MQASERNIRLRTFGRLALTDGAGHEDSSLSTRPRKLALLAWLALRPERRATRDRIVGVFWGDRDEHRARNSLSDAISHLRRVLGRDAIATQASEVILVRDSTLVVDALELKDAARRGDHARVVELYTGPFLDGFYINDAPDFDDWRDRERDCLARMYVRSAAARCAALQASESWEDCRAIADRWLEAEPASAEAALALLRSVAAPATQSAFAATLSSYESIVARLDRELGMAPDEAVSAFARDVAERLSTTPQPVMVAPLPRLEPPAATLAPPPSAPARDGPRVWRAPARAPLVAALAAVAVIALLGLSERHAPALDRRRVIVAALQNRTGDTSLAQLGAVAADWISRGLTDTRAVEVADPSLSVVRGPGPDPRSIGRSAQAGTVVVGSYVREGDSVSMEARLVDANTGRVLRTTAPATAPLSDPLLAVNALRQRVAGAMAAEIDPVIAALAREASQPPTYDAYLAWVEGLDLFSRHDVRGAVAPLLRAAALDTSFVSPRVWAMAAYGNSGDWRRADSLLQSLWPLRARLAPLDRGLVGVWAGDIHGDRMAEYAAAREMVAAAPGSELALFIAGLAALYVNRPVEAIPLLRRIPVDSSAAQWNIYGTQLARALHLAGQHADELRETTRRLSRVPSSMRAMDDQGCALVALGRPRRAVDVAMMILSSSSDASLLAGTPAFDIANELVVHGYAADGQAVYRRIVEWHRTLPADRATSRAARDILVAALTRGGELARADSVARAGLAASPDDPTLLKWHGLVAAQRHDTVEARRASERLARLTTPYLRGSTTVARAEIAAQLGDKAEATRLIRQASAEGITAPTLHSLPEFVLLRGYPDYDAFVKPVG